MSDKVVRNPPQPKPLGPLVVVSVSQDGPRDDKKVGAQVVVRDGRGNEFYFTTTVHRSALKPFYR